MRDLQPVEIEYKTAGSPGVTRAVTPFRMT